MKKKKSEIFFIIENRDSQMDVLLSEFLISPKNSYMYSAGRGTI